MEPGFDVVVGLEVVEDFGSAVPVLDFDVEVWLVTWDFVEEVEMLGFVGRVDPDDSVGCDLSVTILVRDRGDAEFGGCAEWLGVRPAKWNITFCWPRILAYRKPSSTTNWPSRPWKSSACSRR